MEVFSTLYIYFYIPHTLLHPLQNLQKSLRDSFYFHFFHQTLGNGLVMRIIVVAVPGLTSTLLPPVATGGQRAFGEIAFSETSD